MMIGVAAQCRLDLVADAGMIGERIVDDDVVGDAHHAGELADIVLGSSALEVPIDCAAQRQPAVLDLNVDRARRNQHIPFEEIAGALCDLIVGGAIERRADFEMVGDRVHAFDAARRCDRRDLIGVADDVTAEDHSVGLDSNLDVAAVEARIEFELVKDVLTKLGLGHSWPQEYRYADARHLGCWRCKHIDQNQRDPTFAIDPHQTSAGSVRRGTVIDPAACWCAAIGTRLLHDCSHCVAFAHDYVTQS
jgi:hypothetical protein